MRIPFRKQSVDTIMSPITKIATKLDAHRLEQDDLSGFHTVQASNHEAMAAAAVTEANKAAQRARALNQLFG